MEGDWIAAVDWRSGDDRGRSLVELLLPGGGASDACRAGSGDWGVILAGALELAGPCPRSAGDLLEDYRRRGRSSLHQLRGRFAAVIWNRAQRSVLALRDPMGVYPLFVRATGHGALLSPSIERLLEAEPAAAAVDRLALAAHLCHRWIDRERTYFEAVRRLPAGHALWLAESGKTTERYWDPGAVGEPARSDQAERAEPVDWLEPKEFSRFDDLFDRAIRRSIARQPAGIFLSGGLDSVSIADRCAEPLASGSRLLALSLAFRHPACDEAPVQSEVARKLGLEQVMQTVEAKTANEGSLGRAARLAATWPAPLMNVWNGEFHRLARAGRRRGCAVILTGSGGDDWLGVSPYFAADLLRGARLPTLARLVGALRSSHRLRLAAAIRLALWTFGTRALVRHAAGRAARGVAPALHQRVLEARVRRSLPRWLAPSPELRRRLCEPGRSQRAGAVGASFYVREMRRSLDHPLMALELEESFEMGRRLGLRIVHPFLDADLVDFLFRVPPEVLLGAGGPDRALVRDRLARRFPDLGFASQRKSDARPLFAQIARSEGPRLWRRLGGARALGDLGIVNRREVEAEMDEMIRDGNETAGWFRLWDLINLEQWLRGRQE